MNENIFKKVSLHNKILEIVLYRNINKVLWVNKQNKTTVLPHGFISALFLSRLN